MDLLEVLSHRQQRKLSPRSTARWLSTLKGFYRYAVLQQRIDIDPTQQIEHPKLGRVSVSYTHLTLPTICSV